MGTEEYQFECLRSKDGFHNWSKQVQANSIMGEGFTRYCKDCGFSQFYYYNKYRGQLSLERETMPEKWIKE